MAKNGFVIGCPDPYILAERIMGVSINWGEEKDEFDTLANAFGITKEAYLNNPLPLMNPYILEDQNGNVLRLSKKEAEQRLTVYLEKNARRKIFRRGRIQNQEELSPAQHRTHVIGTLLEKDSGLSIRPRKDDLNQGNGEGNNDVPFSMDGFEWKDKGYFFNETALWSDVCQNSIGDCYFLAALCSVVYVDSFKIKNVTGLRYKYKSKEGKRDFAPWHAIDFYVPSGGSIELKNWKGLEKTVQTVVVSEEVLVNSKTGLNYGASGPKEKLDNKVTGNKADLDSNWAAVYEKAYAKFLERTTSDYPKMDRDSILHGGYADEALKEIIHTEQVTYKSTNNLSVDDIWNLGMAARNHPTCASISNTGTEEAPRSKAGSSKVYSEMGLHISHAYSFLGVYSSGDTKYIVLRNPHGRNPIALKNNPKVFHKSWGFNFGVDREDKYDNLWDVYRHLNGNDDPLRSNGLFLLEINEFKRVFTSVSYYHGDEFKGFV